MLLAGLSATENWLLPHNQRLYRRASHHPFPIPFHFSGSRSSSFERIYIIWPAGKASKPKLLIATIGLCTWRLSLRQACTKLSPKYIQEAADGVSRIHISFVRTLSPSIPFVSFLVLPFRFSPSRIVIPSVVVFTRRYWDWKEDSGFDWARLCLTAGCPYLNHASPFALLKRFLPD